jgi:hypothetical protein
MSYMNRTGARVAAVAGVASALAAAAALAAPPQEIAIPGQRVFPESLTSAPDGTVYIGSIGTRTIFRAKPGAAAAEAWIGPSADVPAGYLGVFVDAKSKTLWACALPAGGPGVATPVPTTLHAYDLATGKEKGHYPFPTAGGVCNDIAVGADGSVYATDTQNMEVVTLKKGGTALAVWAGAGGFGPQGGVLDGISVLGKRVLVNTLATSKLFSVPIAADGKSGPITEVKLDRPIDKPDGMRSFGKDSLLIVEGGSAGKLSRITLKGDSGVAVALKEGYPDGAVAVTVVGTTGYVLEAQFAAMRGDPATPTKPFHATAVSVGKP